MSYATAIPAASSRLVQGAHALLHNGSLTSMAKAVGVIAGAGLIGAAYQIASDEGRSIVQTLRVMAVERRNRHEVIMGALLGTDLPLPVLRRVQGSRNAFRIISEMSLDDSVPQDQRKILRDVIVSLMRPLATA